MVSFETLRKDEGIFGKFHDNPPKWHYPLHIDPTRPCIVSPLDFISVAYALRVF